ncbi:hypothetical protein, partial [Angelakisella massiliensis]|uniref:hypothetical protein n=1 Tax=Angelakisella massiliensis TaxID=1871018 RepID=UPI0024B10AAF
CPDFYDFEFCLLFQTGFFLCRKCAELISSVFIHNEPAFYRCFQCCDKHLFPSGPRQSISGFISTKEIQQSKNLTLPPVWLTLMNKNTSQPL